MGPSPRKTFPPRVLAWQPKMLVKQVVGSGSMDFNHSVAANTIVCGWCSLGSHGKMKALCTGRKVFSGTLCPHPPLPVAIGQPPHGGRGLSLWGHRPPRSGSPAAGGPVCENLKRWARRGLLGLEEPLAGGSHLSRMLLASMLSKFVPDFAAAVR